MIVSGMVVMETHSAHASTNLSMTIVLFQASIFPRPLSHYRVAPACSRPPLLSPLLPPPSSPPPLPFPLFPSPSSLLHLPFPLFLSPSLSSIFFPIFSTPFPLPFPSPSSHPSLFSSPSPCPLQPHPKLACRLNITCFLVFYVIILKFSSGLLRLLNCHSSSQCRRILDFPLLNSLKSPLAALNHSMLK